MRAHVGAPSAALSTLPLTSTQAKTEAGGGGGGVTLLRGLRAQQTLERMRTTRQQRWFGSAFEPPCSAGTSQTTATLLSRTRAIEPARLALLLLLLLLLLVVLPLLLLLREEEVGWGGQGARGGCRATWSGCGGGARVGLSRTR
jgi:hypothetical protein